MKIKCLTMAGISLMSLVSIPALTSCGTTSLEGTWNTNTGSTNYSILGLDKSNNFYLYFVINGTRSSFAGTYTVDDANKKISIYLPGHSEAADEYYGNNDYSVLYCITSSGGYLYYYKS